MGGRETERVRERRGSWEEERANLHAESVAVQGWTKNYVLQYRN